MIGQRETWLSGGLDGETEKGTLIRAKTKGNSLRKKLGSKENPKGRLRFVLVLDKFCVFCRREKISSRKFVGTKKNLFWSDN